MVGPNNHEAWVEKHGYNVRGTAWDGAELKDTKPWKEETEGGSKSVVMDGRDSFLCNVLHEGQFLKTNKG